jgi:tetratricopeptide (TPR) repeat protein
MSKKLKKGKRIGAVLVGVFCFLFLVACFELNNIRKSEPPKGLEAENIRIDEEDAAKFVSKIRPYQEDKDSIYRRACYFQERRKYKLAVQDFKRVTHIDPDHAKAFNGMGVAYDHMGQFDLAMECYYKALAINPDLDYVQNNLGYSYLLQRDVDNAIATFKKAISLNSKNKRYHNNLGLAYAKKGLHDLAFQEFKLAGGSNKSRYDIKQIHFKKNKMEFDRQESETVSSADTLTSRDGSTSLTAKTSLVNQQEDHTRREGLTGVWPTSRPNSKSIGLNGLDIRTSRIAPLDSNRNLEKNADSLRRGFGAKAGSGRESSRNADLIGAAESYTSVEEASSMNNSRAQISSYTLNVDSQLPPTLDKIKKDSRHEKVGPLTDQGSSYPSLDRVSMAGQRHDRYVEIEISNGNGVRHMARRVGGYLKEKGYKVTRLTNAGHFHFDDTTIYYCSGHLQDAYQVAREMPGWNEMIKVANLGRPSIKVKVLIGKDLVLYSRLFEGKGLDGDFPHPLKIANFRRDDRSKGPIAIRARD